MIRLSRRTSAALAATAAAALLSTTAGPASAQPAPRSPAASGAVAAARGVPDGIPSAQRALARAQALFAAPHGAAARAAGTPARHPRDATLVLRDLSARVGELTGADRATAEALLARPDGGKTGTESGIGALWPNGAPAFSDCSVVVPVCVHWTTSGKHAPPTADTSPANGIPDQVDDTLATMEDVWQEETGALGYRAPLTDERGSIDNDGTNFDVYLSDIGDGGYYGYCAIDDTRSFKNYAYYDRSSYCVLDDDYAEFPTHTALQNLQVTAAHEFFHAVQFAYDAYEDRWFMESTAAWVEDVLYDAVNDNRQYLARSPLRRPDVPLDKGTGTYVYGSWLFFRYLSEQYGDAIVRSAWEAADGSTPASVADELHTYSLPALGTALAAQGTTLATQFGDFAAANTDPADFYTEGASYRPFAADRFRVSPSRPRTPWLYADLDHLSAVPAVIQAGRGTPLDARLRLSVDGPALASRPQARALVRFADGSVTLRRFALDSRGTGAVVVPFGRRAVTSVTLVLANGSSRYRQCFTGSPYGGLSCWGGQPVDNGRRYVFRASLV